MDRVEIGGVPVGEGFWKRGNFSGDNIWANGTRMAPFDQEVSPQVTQNCQIYRYIVYQTCFGVKFFFI